LGKQPVPVVPHVELPTWSRPGLVLAGAELGADSVVTGIAVTEASETGADVAVVSDVEDRPLVPAAVAVKTEVLT